LPDYDLLIIGGGINGLGIAADAAARGLSTLLVEKGDFGGGTTAASSRLIHGGLRYLQHMELSLVRESLRERGLLLRQRPHLVHRLPLLIPWLRGRRPGGWAIWTGLQLYQALARDPLFAPPRALNRAAVERREPGLSRRGLQGGHLYEDAQVPFPERLCIELLRETVEAGGTALNHTRVVALHQQEGRVTGARLRDELDGREWDVAAALTINAAGPWVDCVNRLLPHPPPPLLGGTWGSHLVLPHRPEGPRGALYAAAKRDGRPFFLLPWDGRLLVGTTDVPFEGDPDTLQVQEWEVEYLLEETNLLFPGCRYAAADVQFTTIGVRPLPATGAAPGAITRRHFLVDHAARHNIAGLASVIGGKLTTYRSLAEQVVDWALRTLACPPVPCPTRHIGRVPLPATLIRDCGLGIGDCGLGTTDGGRQTADGRGGPPSAVCRLPSADRDPHSALAVRLVSLYGPRYNEVLEVARRRPDLARPLVAGCPALAAEVVHALEREGARTVDDLLLRRLMLLPPTPELRAVVEEWAGVSV
jgi:glycerol-3-phosphate dehydrogenase